MEEKTWGEWTDVTGNIYRPGDIVAIATVSGRSPQLVIAEVLQINKVDSKGTPITARKFIEHEEPIMKTRTERRYDYNTRSYETVEVSYLEKGEYQNVPSCTVKARPLQDTRKFYRSTNAEGQHKPVTYSIIENIVKLADGEGQ